VPIENVLDLGAETIQELAVGLSVSGLRWFFGLDIAAPALAAGG
jgi:hypothetical protein